MSPKLKSLGCFTAIDLFSDEAELTRNMMYTKMIVPLKDCSFTFHFYPNARLSPSRKQFFICFDNPSKMLKNVFYFIFKELFRSISKCVLSQPG